MTRHICLHGSSIHMNPNIRIHVYTQSIKIHISNMCVTESSSPEFFISANQLEQVTSKYATTDQHLRLSSYIFQEPINSIDSTYTPVIMEELTCWESQYTRIRNEHDTASRNNNEQINRESITQKNPNPEIHTRLPNNDN